MGDTFIVRAITKLSACHMRILVSFVAVAVIFSNGALAADSVESSGDLIRLAIPAVAVAMTIRRDDKTGRRQFLKSFGLNVASTWALKEVVDKDRPDGSGQDAFPSGHSSMAFQGAAFIHRRYGIKAAWPTYALATYVAWTRVDSDQHDVVDVAAGAALGIASSMWLTQRAQGVNVATLLGPDTIGITVSSRF